MGFKLHDSTLGLALLGLAALPASARADDGEGWQWTVAPYVWAPSIRTDLSRTEPPEGGAASDTEFDDVLDKIDGAFLIHAEGQTDHWGVFGDFIFLGLADEADRPRFRTESDLNSRVLELAAFWRPGGQRARGLDVFAGLRYIDLDLDVRFDPENPLFETTRLDADETYSDLMIGARYTWAVSDRWGVTLRGDGSFGETEGAWNASVVGSYRMRHGAWLFGYRYLSVELDTRDAAAEITLNGPMIGYGFIF